MLATITKPTVVAVPLTAAAVVCSRKGCTTRFVPAPAAKRGRPVSTCHVHRARP